MPNRLSARLRFALALCFLLPAGAAFPAVAGAADVSLDKEPTGGAGVTSLPYGATVSYTLTVTNTPAEAATNVVVTDLLPAGMTFTYANASQGTCARSGNTVVCTLGTIAASGTATVTVRALLVSAEPVPGASVTNVAVVEASNDTTPDNNADSVTLNVVVPVFQGDFTVTKSDSPDPIEVGELLTYTITVEGAPIPVVVYDNLPAGVTVVGATTPQGNCSTPLPTSTFTVVCSVLPVVTPSGVAVATITVLVRPTTADTITNEVTIGQATGEPFPSNNTVTETTTVTAPTAVTLRSLNATASRAGNLVRWRTASEIDTLGFHVYRQVSGKRVRVNRTLIAAKGRGGYSFLDRKAPKGKSVRYWLQVVNLDGSRSWYGPARVLRT